MSQKPLEVPLFPSGPVLAGSDAKANHSQDRQGQDTAPRRGQFHKLQQ